MDAHTAELMDHRAPAEDDMVLDRDVPRQRHHVRQDGVAADL